uniref:Uncharacterized protein n=1 Tax=Picea sitchensis TaxID=3332 RepID=A9NSM0_PICSI|nr:unknown [Picea sitchensis]
MEGSICFFSLSAEYQCFFQRRSSGQEEKMAHQKWLKWLP